MESIENLKENVETIVKKCKILSDSDKNSNTETTLQFVKISEKAHTPVYGSTKAAGADLCSAEDCVIPAKGKYLVHTGLKIAIPSGYYGRIAPRSGLALKHFIDVGAGVIDEDYRGEVNVLLFNFSNNDFQIKSGDRIAQLICEKYKRFTLQQVEKLDETERNAGGFGSTGIK